MSNATILLSNKLFPRNIPRIAKSCLFRHLRSGIWNLTYIFFLSIAPLYYGQERTQKFELSREDINENIRSFKTTDVSKSILGFKQKMPEPVIDAKLRQGIIDSLPAFVSKLRVNDRALEMSLRKVLNPVLALYGRENLYDLVVVRHSTPLIFSDSGVVIVITTGALMEVKNDDELLGVIAHEVGHEYFAQYSIYTRHLLKEVSDTGKEQALIRHLSEIMMI